MAEKLVFELSAVDRATAPLKAVTNQINRTTQAINQQASAYNRTAVATNKFAKGALQQAGYQVGDFFVQITNGTSAIQAFGQQGSQMLGIFGPIGAVIGAGVAILASFGVAAEKAQKRATDFAASGAKIVESFSRLDQLKFPGFSEAARVALAEFQPVIDFLESQELKKLRESVDAIVSDVAGPAGQEVSHLTKLLAAQEASYRNIVQFQGVESKQAKDRLSQIERTRVALFRNQDVYESLTSIAGRTQIELVKSVQASMERLKAQKLLTPELEAAFESLLKSVDATGAISASTKETERNISGSVSGSKGMADELERAARAVSSINISAESKLALLQAEVRARTRGLADEQVRIQQAGIMAERAAISAGVTGAAELAAIAARASEIERNTISAENSLKSFQVVAEDVASASSTKFDGLTTTMYNISETSKQISSAISTSMSQAFMSIVDGTASAKEAFRDMARTIIAKLYEILVVQRMVSAIMNFFGGGPKIPGTSIPKPPPSPFAGARAMGGQVTAGRPYLVGERGPELIVPSRNSHVVPNGQGQGGNIVVQQTINVSTGVQQTVRSEIRSMLPQIAEASKAAVLDARRRGGNFSAAFG